MGRPSGMGGMDAACSVAAQPAAVGGRRHGAGRLDRAAAGIGRGLDARHDLSAGGDADVGVAAKIFGSQSRFTRFLGRNTTYHPIGKKLVVARSTAFGWLQPITRQLTTDAPSAADIFSGAAFEQIPIAERFLSGGGNSHRGFPENQAGPRDAATGFPVGGQALLFLNHQLRCP